ncbi:CaiB/BaiF CoA-transferase family protein [Kitasatospora purpeofusca]|uniref:CaiB/BaiF CoA transferase family protein n=1 Tax=Kitasatospora purpeofusca TaxID=67352 RepID=UPI002A59EA6C|nr:CaiB/BaiF CoA-transferase family protein [Kitasatospora purpeofusca]MDY0813620.1 CaiB/BaiF CoA-transferase family protein [Kitasatospora purpeofusca]
MGDSGVRGGGAGGPLAGVRVVELAGIGPGPFAAMLLGDLGADVVRVDRPESSPLGIEPTYDIANRNKRSVVVDLKAPDGPGRVLDLVARADLLIEGYRPGVAERLGVGPEACLARNPALVYGRMTGWGQHGPLAARAGHDIGYTAVAGVLGLVAPTAAAVPAAVSPAAAAPAVSPAAAPSGPDGPPALPANLLGDYAGGSLYLVVGLLAALHHSRATGAGQVVDAAIVDGAAHLTAVLQGLLAGGRWQDRRGVNLLDGGAPFYAVYPAADGGHLAVGALEPQFYAEFARLLGLGPDAPGQWDTARWPELRAWIAARFATRTRAAWEAVFAGSDACVEPVLTMRQAHAHEHLASRGTYVEVDGVTQPAPAPRFSATPGALRRPPARPGADAAEVARDWGVPSLASESAESAEPTEPTVPSGPAGPAPAPASPTA